MNRFKLIRVMISDNWPSGHIAIDHYHTYPNKAGGDEYCLTDDTCSAEELSAEIDKLINELEQLRESAPRKFEEWRSQLAKRTRS